MGSLEGPSDEGTHLAASPASPSDSAHLCPPPLPSPSHLSLVSPLGYGICLLTCTPALTLWLLPLKGPLLQTHFLSIPGRAPGFGTVLKYSCLSGHTRLYLIICISDHGSRLRTFQELELGLIHFPKPEALAYSRCSIMFVK